MTKPTEKQRIEYRRALMRGGVPAVYAHMAAQELTTKEPVDASASELLWSGFIWASTQQGHEFWSAIADEASA